MSAYSPASSSLRDSHLVETDWLAERIVEGAANLRIIDMRGYVRTQNAPDGYQTATYTGAPEEYAAAHIPGAIYLDWTTDIVDENDPVPAQVAPPEKIARILGENGIGDDSLIVVYDMHPASQFATRLWWVLRYYGNHNVRVLNGGWAKWKAEERPVTEIAPQYPPATFTPRPQPEWRMTAEETLQATQNPNAKIIDARDEGQYTGKLRRGAYGGHIPTATHLPREAFFTSENVFRPEAELHEIIAQSDIKPDQTVIAYCNGGVAATSVLFTLSMLGHERLTNYDGSWNEWGMRDDLPHETSL